MFKKLFFLFLLFSTLGFSSISFAAGKKPINIEETYVDGKVNDPVTKSARTAYIFTENPTLSFTLPEGKKVDIVLYCNSYVESEDRGIRNRMMKKSVIGGEKFKLLPEEDYLAAKEDGSLYNTADHCYVLRVYEEGSEQYDEYYFGIVEEDIFKDYQEKAKEKELLLKQKLSQYGPAAMQNNENKQ